MKELIARGDLERCLVVCPGSLAEQWQDELEHRFQLHFTVYTSEALQAARPANWFEKNDLVIARLDMLSRNEEVQELLQAPDCRLDLVVCDEAHKMSAAYFGRRVKYTKRYRLGQLLGRLTRHFLLMTATPHNGKEDDFQLFMALLDGDRFEGRFRSGVHRADTSDLMRRMVKEKLLKFDGTPLFPVRRAYTVPYRLSQAEASLYDAVTQYVKREFNRADALGGKKRTTIGFALTILQRRLASSPEAIYRSLRRRRERLRTRLQELEEFLRTGGAHAQFAFRGPELDLEDLEDAPEDEAEAAEAEVLDQATAAQSSDELRAEINTLRRLERLARDLLNRSDDTKWRESEALVVIHGGMNRRDRLKAQEAFRNDPTVKVLLATDATGEGINLQRAHLMVNYDLPWNPNRLEQRFGRIHRIGQTEVCHLWNLLAEDTREGKVYQTLLDKLETERRALGGQVFDVLGQVQFEGRSLKDLLVQAIRFGEQPEIRAHLDTVVSEALDRDRLRGLMHQHGWGRQAAGAAALSDLTGARGGAKTRRRHRDHGAGVLPLPAHRVREVPRRDSGTDPRGVRLSRTPAPRRRAGPDSGTEPQAPEARRGTGRRPRPWCGAARSPLLGARGSRRPPDASRWRPGNLEADDYLDFGPGRCAGTRPVRALPRFPAAWGGRTASR